MSAGRLPADVEATAYFVISEGLTNVVKHASADHATVTVQAEPGAVRVEIRDDGIGGADPARGSGLVGISDITKDGTSLPALEGLLAWIACIGDAQPLQSYAEWLSATGLHIIHAEPRSHYLQEMVQGVRSKLLMAEIMVGLKKLDFPGLDLSQAKAFSKAAQEAIASNRCPTQSWRRWPDADHPSYPQNRPEGV